MPRVLKVDSNRFAIVEGDLWWPGRFDSPVTAHRAAALREFRPGPSAGAQECRGARRPRRHHGCGPRPRFVTDDAGPARARTRRPARARACFRERRPRAHVGLVVLGENSVRMEGPGRVEDPFRHDALTLPEHVGQQAPVFHRHRGGGVRDGEGDAPVGSGAPPSLPPRGRRRGTARRLPSLGRRPRRASGRTRRAPLIADRMRPTASASTAPETAMRTRRRALRRVMSQAVLPGRRGCFRRQPAGRMPRGGRARPRRGRSAGSSPGPIRATPAP